MNCNPNPVIEFWKDLAKDNRPNAVCPTGFKFVTFNPNQHVLPARALLNKAYKSGGGDVLDVEDWWHALSNDPEYDQACCFLIEHIETAFMAGFSLCWNTGFVKDIAIDETYRRRGVGSALMEHIFQYFYDRGLHKVSLKVLKNNPSGAVRFYQNLGMQRR